MKKRIHQKPKHVLSVLRKIIDVGLKQSKETLGLSRDTVKSIQSGRLSFSEQNMRTVSQKTGVSFKWLLDQDGNKPPKTESGERFTRQTFEKHEAKIYEVTQAWSSPINFNIARLGSLTQFRTLSIKLAALMLVAHMSQKVGYVDAMLEKEMRRLAAILRKSDHARAFESMVWKQVKDISGEKETGIVTVFNEYKKALPPEKKWIWETPEQSSSR